MDNKAICHWIDEINLPNFLFLPFFIKRPSVWSVRYDLPKIWRWRNILKVCLFDSFHPNHPWLGRPKHNRSLWSTTSAILPRQAGLTRLAAISVIRQRSAADSEACIERSSSVNRLYSDIISYHCAAPPYQNSTAQSGIREPNLTPTSDWYIIQETSFQGSLVLQANPGDWADQIFPVRPAQLCHPSSRPQHILLSSWAEPENPMRTTTGGQRGGVR